MSLESEFLSETFTDLLELMLPLLAFVRLRLVLDEFEIFVQEHSEWHRGHAQSAHQLFTALRQPIQMFEHSQKTNPAYKLAKLTLDNET